ncbi:hypothetical protein HDU98_003865 [Podochytrium sp. JEL0797]|nr:hypothetical protein HDU98_003865 [Podochytrium sp. JEL0797]
MCPRCMTFEGTKYPDTLATLATKCGPQTPREAEVQRGFRCICGYCCSTLSSIQHHVSHHDNSTHPSGSWRTMSNPAWVLKTPNGTFTEAAGPVFVGTRKEPGRSRLQDELDNTMEIEDSLALEEADHEDLPFLNKTKWAQSPIVVKNSPNDLLTLLENSEDGISAKIDAICLAMLESTNKSLGDRSTFEAHQLIKIRGSSKYIPQNDSAADEGYSGKTFKAVNQATVDKYAHVLGLCDSLSDDDKLPDMSWNGDFLSVGRYMPISLEMLRSGIQLALARLDSLIGTFMHGLPVDKAKLVPTAVFDDNTNHAIGYGFTSDQRNPQFKVNRSSVINFNESQPAFRSLYLDATGGWKMEGIRTLSGLCDEYVQVLEFLMTSLGGAPARKTDMTQQSIVNSVSSPRTLYVIEGHLAAQLG